MIAVADRRLLLPPNIAVPLTPGIILAASAVAVAGAADLNENTLATINVPANAIGKNGILRLTAQWTLTNNVNAKTLRVRYSGGAGSAYLSASSSSVAGAVGYMYLQNRNVTNSQFAQAHLVSGNALTGNSPSTGAVDTTAATSLVITGQKAVAGDVLQLDAYMVELFYGA